MIFRHAVLPFTGIVLAAFTTAMSWPAGGMAASILPTPASVSSSGAGQDLAESRLDSKGNEPEPSAPVFRIYGTDWGLTLNGDGSGFYNDLARLVLTDTAGLEAYTIRPYRRAKTLFHYDKNACLYPSNRQLLVDGGEIEDTSLFLDSAAFLQVKVFLFSRPGTKPPASIHDVDHKSVGYAMGARIPYFLREANADFIAVTEEVAKAQMLLSGRVDLISAAMPDAKFVFDKLGAELPPHDPSYKLNDTPVRVTCHDTPANRQFIKLLDARIEKLISEGALKALLMDNGLDAETYIPAP